MSEATIFAGALGKKTPQERAAYLDAACGGDEELRRRVEALLASDEGAGSFLLRTPDAVHTEAERAGLGTADESTAEGPGSHVGPYRLIEQIGEGGMGVVYMAEQE